MFINLVGHIEVFMMITMMDHFMSRGKMWCVMMRCVMMRCCMMRFCMMRC